MSLKGDLQTSATRYIHIKKGTLISLTMQTPLRNWNSPKFWSRYATGPKYYKQLDLKKRTYFRAILRSLIFSNLIQWKLKSPLVPLLNELWNNQLLQSEFVLFCFSFTLQRTGHWKLRLFFKPTLRLQTFYFILSAPSLLGSKIWIYRLVFRRFYRNLIFNSYYL